MSRSTASPTTELTSLQRDERDALAGDRDAVIRVISALRRYREEVRRALDLRWGDGAIDGAISSSLASRIDDIED